MGKSAAVYGVIMAGGGGTRFWPWSREKQPKQILPIISKRAMIYETVARISPFIPPEKTLIVTSRTLANAIHREVPQVPRSNLLMEPSAKNTAPCLGLAALHIQKCDPEAVMVVLPSDHFIGNSRQFLATLKAAVSFAQKKDFLVTLGVIPTEPETGYGYIQRGKILDQIGQVPVFQAKAFREKPNRSRAKMYLKKGDYYWNSGMFVWRVGVFEEAFQRYLPQIYQEMAQIREVLGTPLEKKAMEKAYCRIPSISIDYGIMEKSPKVALLEANFPWNDVGNWTAVAKIWPADRSGNVIVQGNRRGRGNVLAIESFNCVICGRDKLIAMVGLNDMVLVETDDAILICPKDRSQDVRLVLEEIKKKGWKQYL